MGGVAFAAALTSAQPSRAVPPAQATALSASLSGQLCVHRPLFKSYSPPHSLLSSPSF